MITEHPLEAALPAPNANPRRAGTASAISSPRDLIVGPGSGALPKKVPQFWQIRRQGGGQGPIAREDRQAP
eukprot:12932586-Prorocentrum_lima.AAC.1